jgi:DNA (cytosine-5)-methyltransferase 1
VKHLDLFSGIGGFALGLQKVGFETVAFCDIEKYCQHLLKQKWNGVKIYNDVREITKEKFKADGIEFPEIITGGFPCQPFSVAGSRKGTDDNRHLWPEMFRIIKEFKPRWIIGENVRGIVSIQDGLVFETVCTDLESEGYEVQTFNIPAVGVGAPHKRERIWIVANSRCSVRGKQSSRNSESIGSGTFEKTERSTDTSEITRSSTGTETMANSESIRSGELGHISEEKRIEGSNTTQSNSSSTDVANTNSERQQEQCRPKSIQQEGNEFECDGSQERINWWEVEPDVGRVADGLPGRVHRLKGLGNAIVPQIAEEIGRAIMKAEQQ